MNEPDPVPTPESAPAPATVWTIKPTDVRRAFSGGGRLSTSLLFRTTGPAAEISARANALGRTVVREQLRASQDAGNPQIAHFSKLQTESAALSLEGRRVAAKLATLRASREETLLEAAPGFSGQVVLLDAQIADMAAKADQSAAASAAIAVATATARGEALRALATIVAAVAAKEHSGLRRRREELVASLPAKISATLSELASIDRAISQAPALPSHLDAMLDELAKAPPPEAAPAASNEPVPSPEAPSAAPGEPSAATETLPEEAAEPLSSAPPELSGPRRRKA
jgi:hypothetical protein